MKKNITAGIVLIVVGIIAIFQRTVDIPVSIWSILWPCILIIPGISMHLEYFATRKNPQILIPAAILTVYGCLFLTNAVTDWDYVSKLTFLYPLGVAIGFGESYYFGSRQKEFGIVALVMILVSAYVLIRNMFPQIRNIREYLIPALLILAGVMILFRRKRIEE